MMGFYQVKCQVLKGYRTLLSSSLYPLTHHSGYLYSVESYPKIQQLRTMNLQFLQIRPRSGSVPLMRFPSSQKLQSNESFTGAGGRKGASTSKKAVSRGGWQEPSVPHM
ncbi:unnamed protein product [Rangifer tarandus platyrhynchus]|uniref:Uncharacterized protein n=2 Tax=Rangifer tarandus platyrhynchus TaxID=3082113 RepID=A0ABN8ZE46_RANTA|nr:unnamed protein product [Rangifer tarandus platyrhynchus]